MYQTYVTNGGGKMPRGITRLLDETSKTPTATHYISGNSNGTRLPDATGSGKYKMAASKRQQLISQFVNKTTTKFQRSYLRFRGPSIQ